MTARSELARFLGGHADKDDSYEVWGGSERPDAVVTMGTLRALASPLSEEPHLATSARIVAVDSPGAFTRYYAVLVEGQRFPWFTSAQRPPVVHPPTKDHPLTEITMTFAIDGPVTIEAP